MGKAFSSIVKRPVKNWNIESRAHRVLDKNPKVAPKHQTTERKIEEFRRENPGLLEAQQMKDESLHSRLSGMVVNPEKVGEFNSARPLPENRMPRPMPEFGYKEPEKIPEGRLSIKQALEILNRHTVDPGANTVQTIAKDFKLQPVHVQNILKHFQVLLLQMPLDKDGKPFQVGQEGNVQQQSLTPGSLKTLQAENIDFGISDSNDPLKKPR